MVPSNIITEQHFSVKVFSSADDGHVSHDEFKDYFTQVNLHFINDVITIKIKVLFSHVTMADCSYPV